MNWVGKNEPDTSQRKSASSMLSDSQFGNSVMGTSMLGKSFLSSNRNSKSQTPPRLRESTVDKKLNQLPVVSEKDEKTNRFTVLSQSIQKL